MLQQELAHALRHVSRVAWGGREQVAAQLLNGGVWVGPGERALRTFPPLTWTGSGSVWAPAHVCSCLEGVRATARRLPELTWCVCQGQLLELWPVPNLSILRSFTLGIL